MESEPQKQNVKAVESVADWIIGLVNSSPDPENRIDNVPAHEASPGVIADFDYCRIRGVFVKRKYSTSLQKIRRRRIFFSP